MNELDDELTNKKECSFTEDSMIISLWFTHSTDDHLDSQQPLEGRFINTDDHFEICGSFDF